VTTAEVVGVVLGSVGLVGTVAAAVDARLTGRRTRALLGRVRTMTKDMSFVSRAERAERVERAVDAVMSAVKLARAQDLADRRAEAGEGPAWDLGGPIDQGRLLHLVTPLRVALTGAGLLELPAGWALWRHMSGLGLGEARYRPLAVEHLDPLGALAEAALREAREAPFATQATEPPAARENEPPRASSKWRWRRRARGG
jgi:hypothetical protein